MGVNQNTATIHVSFRLNGRLVKRLRKVTDKRRRWPPPPSQTEIVSRGIEMALAQLERRGRLRNESRQDR